MNVTEASEGRPRDIHIDMPAFEAIARNGLYRVSAFIAYAQSVKAYPALTALSHKTGAVHWTIPEIGDELAGELRDEFSKWAVNMALVELDQMMNRLIGTAVTLLDRFVPVASGEEHHPTRIPQKRTSELHRSFYGKVQYLPFTIKTWPPGSMITQECEWGCLEALAIIRNCLIHDGGFVLEHRLGSRDQIVLEWLAMQAFASRPDGTNKTAVNDEAYIVSEADAAEGFTMSIETVTRRRAFVLHERVSFETAEVAELGRFYERIAMQISASLHQAIVDAGAGLGLRPPLRNAMCHCGSGKRFKHCHGGLAADGSAAASDASWFGPLGSLRWINGAKA